MEKYLKYSICFLNVISKRGNNLRILTEIPNTYFEINRATYAKKILEDEELADKLRSGKPRKKHDKVVKSVLREISKNKN